MIEVLKDYVMVKKDEGIETSKGGIFIPDNSKEKPSTGVVVGAGVGAYQNGTFVPMTVKKDDRVIFLKNTGSTVEDEGETYTILKIDDILGIIR